MYLSDKAIKIIKREHREVPAELQEAPESRLKTESQSRRETFRIVTSWIEEQREARKELALPKGLLKEIPRAAAVSKT